MSDTYGSGFGGSFGAPDSAGGPPTTLVGNNPFPVGPTQPQPEADPGDDAATLPPGPTPSAPSFGKSFRDMMPGPKYDQPDPQLSPLDQTADLLQQRVRRAGAVATNPLAQIFAPERVQAARDFMPKATEQLQKIEQQKSAIQAGRVQAQTLGLAPGEASDQATQEDRITIASAKALKGDLRAFQGIQAVAPDRAAAIAPQVYEVVAGNLNNAQLAFDSLASMQNEGQYQAKLKQLRTDGTLSKLESLGMKVPPSFDAFNASKALEGRALREARIAINTIGQQLEARNTYQPMEKKEAETYTGRLTTVYGDEVSNGTWSRNAASGVRGFVNNGMATVDSLGRGGTLGNKDQRKEIGEELRNAIPKEEIEKKRSFDRTLALAEPTPEQKKRGQLVNDNPNVQQGISEGLASMLRGGAGGANVGLLKIETGKRGVVQSLLDTLVTAYGGAVNTLSKEQIRPYLTTLTQKQQREVLDGLKQWNDNSLNDRAAQLARRAGALGFDVSALGLGDSEVKGGIAAALEEGRQAQIERMRPHFQPIGGGDGVIQLGAQRPGVGAADLPPGTQRTTELPGATPLLTPVQQATGQPQPQPSAPQPGAPAPAPSPVPSPSGGGAGQPSPTAPAPGTPPAPQPVRIAGQDVTVPLPEGVSPEYVSKLQRVETGNSKDPWTATTKKGVDGKPISSAGGAFQMLDATWNENKPAGAPDRAKDATPTQQAQAVANLAKKDAATLTKNGIPVNDTSLYVAHNLGAAGGSRLMMADPNADAREVVGERAAANNPKFFKGRPTVATVLQRYAEEMNKPVQVASRSQATDAGPEPEPEGPKTPPSAGGATAEPPRRDMRAAREAARGRGEGPDLSGERRTGEQLGAEWRGVGDTAVEHAPAIGSTVGGLGGFAFGGPVGGVAGGAAGGGAGQALKDYLQGRPANPLEIVKQTALGGALGVMSEARPIAAAVTRTVGAGAVEGGAKAIEGGNAADIAEAAGKGAGLASAGEAFGRALGMAGHKVFNMFGADAKVAVQTAAKEYSEATEILSKEAPKIPGVGGGAATVNPKYQAAEAAQKKAEQTLKDAGLNPEEAAYAYKVSSDKVPRQEAEVGRPAALEKQAVGEGYQQIERDVGDKGVGKVKATPKLPDGPMAAVANKTVPKSFEELAEKVEMAITAPAKNWQEKWVQLKDARSDLLEKEREALSSTGARRGEVADAYRALADTVRKQQEGAAKAVFGPVEGPKVIKRLEVLDRRYRRLMEVTGAKPNESMGEALMRTAKLKGEAGREADKRFRAFAGDDKVAVAAWDAMRRGKSDVERDVRTGVLSEKIPVLGHVISAVKLAATYNEWRAAKLAGDPVKFGDLLGIEDKAGRQVRDILGSTGARLAVQ